MGTKLTQSRKTYIGVLLVSVVAAMIAMIATDGKLDLSAMGRTRSTPTDKEENMVYCQQYRTSSSQVLERDGIILKADGTELTAYALTEQVSLNAGSISERSSRPIQVISEYVGNFYLYDGNTVYRLPVGGGKLRATVKDCLKFEPMGNYIYSLKQKKDETRLFRCSINGSDEKILFKDEVVDFWAQGGDLLLKQTDGKYRWYNVLNQNSWIHSLPENLEEIVLYGGDIHYRKEESLYRMPCGSVEVSIVTEVPVRSWCVAEGNGAVLYEADSSGMCNVLWFDLNQEGTMDFKSKSFPEGSVIDISASHVFVTEPDGKTWYSSLDEEKWVQIFV